MSYRVKLQEVKRPKNKSFYVNLPLPLVETMNLEMGENFYLEIEDKNKLIFRRANKFSPRILLPERELATYTEKQYASSSLKWSDKYSVQLNTLNPSDYIKLFRSPGWDAPCKEQVDTALRNSLAVFSVYTDKTLIGMGRLVGDRAETYIFRDIVILPKYQKQGIGTLLMNVMLDYIANDLPSGWHASCELLASQGKSAFYQKFGFKPLPNPFLENAMMQMIEGRSKTDR